MTANHAITWRAVVLWALLVFVFSACSTAPPPAPTVSPDRLQLAITDNRNLGRPMQALYQVEALAARVGWSADLHREAGDLWHLVGDDTRALFHWEQAAIQQTDPLLLRDLAQTYLNRSEWTAATDTLQRLLTLQSDNPWANFHLALILAPSDPQQVQPYLQQAALDPLYSEAARALRVAIIEAERDDTLNTLFWPLQAGQVMVAHGLWPFAEAAFRYANTVTIATLGEPYPEALAYMGLAQDRQGKDGAAMLFEAVRLRPDDAQIRFLQALHYRHVGDVNASLNAIIQAVSLSPDSPALYAELGTAYRLTGNLEQAERWYRAAVAYSHDAPQFQQILQQFYAEEAYNLGNTGLEALDAALVTNPNDPDLLSGLGWAYYNFGDREAALAQLERALEISPSNHRAMYYKARILLDSGDDGAVARRLLEQVAGQDDRFSEEAGRILEGLER